MATYKYLCRLCGFRNETQEESCPACGASGPLERVEVEEDTHAPTPPHGPETPRAPEPEAPELDPVEDADSGPAYTPPRFEPDSGPFRDPETPRGIGAVLRDIRFKMRYEWSDRIPRVASVLAFIVIVYIAYVGFSSMTEALWRDEDTAPPRPQPAETPAAERSDRLPPPAERANTTQVVTGVVRSLNDPDRPHLNFQVITDAGESIPVSLRDVDGDRWLGRRVRLTLRYADDGVRFRILVWEADRPATSGRGAEQPSDALSGVIAAAVDASSVFTESAFPADEYRPERAFDGDPSTVWVENAEDEGAGEWLEVDLGSRNYVEGIEVINGFSYRDYYLKNNRVRRMRIECRASLDGDLRHVATASFEDRRDGEYQYAAVGADCRIMRFVIEDVYDGWKYDDTCLSEIRLLTR